MVGLQLPELKLSVTHEVIDEQVGAARKRRKMENVKLVEQELRALGVPRNV